MELKATSFILLSFILSVFCKTSNILDIPNKKEWEKLLRTRTNVLVLYKQSSKAVPSSLQTTLAKVAEDLRGTATIVQVDCSDNEAKKICKKEKLDVSAYLLRHYSRGEFNKDYDRPETVKSMSSFLRDPSSEAPWEEEASAVDVTHIEDMGGLKKLLTSESKPFLIMFYAPWCGHCKRLKPEYSKAATELKNEAIMAAMDLNKPHNSPLKEAFNISGFPTLYYFREGRFRFPYEGPRTKDALVSWMRNPVPPTRPNSEGMDVPPAHGEL